MSNASKSDLPTALGSRHAGAVKLATFAPEAEQVRVDAIRADGGTQMRAGLNEPTVEEYAEAMRDLGGWGKFPPVTVYHDGTTYWLADGFHRVAAAHLAGIESAEANVHAGDRRAAILHAAGANANHGLRRTNADKRRAVETLLRDSEWQKWSDREIARACSVSPDTVGRLRRDGSLSESDSENESDTRTFTTRHGTVATMQTANIGRTAAPAWATVADLRTVVTAWLGEQLASYDASGEIWRLKELLDDNKSSVERRGRLEARISNGGIERFRADDLDQAIRAEIQAREEARDAAAKAAPPPAPSAWDLERKIEAWLGKRELSPPAQHDLLMAVREQEDKHADWAEIVALLPERWTKRALKQALSNLTDSLSYKIGTNEWEAHQLPSGRWYAKNKARSAQATPPHESEAAALADIDAANYGNLKNYQDLHSILHNEGDGWHINHVIANADADLLRELKIGLDQRATEADPPPFVTERLQKVNARVQEAAALVQLVAPDVLATGAAQPFTSLADEPTVGLQPEEAALTLPDDLAAAGFRIIQPKPDWWAILREEGEIPFESDWVAVDDFDRAIEEARAFLQEMSFGDFEAWLAAAPRDPNLRTCLGILELAKTMASRVRLMEPTLENFVTNALPTWSQLINKIEKKVKNG